MRASLFVLTVLAATVHLGTSQANNVSNDDGDRLISCMSCLASETRCMRKCYGRYCYFSEAIMDGVSTIKRGCLNATDSGVGDCTFNPIHLPGSVDIIQERFCVCSSDDCNISSGRRLAPSLAALLALPFVLFLRY